jgi:hypothetical protein
MLCRHDAADLDRYLKNDPSHYLHWAVLHNNVPRKRQLLDSGYDIDNIDQRHGAPLHIATWCDRAAAFQLLFICGADLDILDFGGEGRPRDTPIRLAAQLGRRYLFKRLWSVDVARNKHDPDIPIHAHCSLIGAAALEGHAKIVEDALKWSEEWTQAHKSHALHVACRE